MKTSFFSVFILFTGLAVPFEGPQAMAAPLAPLKVQIENMKFNPDQLGVQAGQTVIWENKDLVPHTVTDEAGSFQSGDIPVAGSWKRTFKKPGKVSYKCSYHPTMKAFLEIHR